MADDPLREALLATRRAAQDLTIATAKLTRHIAEKAEAAAKDPSGPARKAVEKVAKGLNEMVNDLERILKDL
jgi:signal transduction histidine kinase